jgi:hypothetical protein
MPIEQPTQVRNSRTFDDTAAAGATMEATPGDLSLENDLNNVRAQLKRHNNASVGGSKWYDAVLDSFDLRAIHDKMFAFRAPLIPGASEFTLVGTPSGVLVDATMFAGALLGVGAGSTTNGGYLAADAGANFSVAGALGTPDTSNIVDPAGILLNRVRVINAATNEAPRTVNDEEIFGLLQVIGGTADGTAIGGAGSENTRISFAFYNKTTDVLTLTSLPAATYQFFPVRQYNFFTLTKGSLISDIPPETLDPTQIAVRLPWREYEIASASVAAGDPVNVTTGSFTTAGAQTNTSTFGTPALPATGASFRDDNRVKVWVNGLIQQKNATAGKDVYWISTTQMAFNYKLHKKDVIAWETPQSY